MNLVLQTVSELRSWRSGLGTVVLVPTMGALHEGHLSLVRRASQFGANVIVSIFVNPLQFGANEDLDRYPRDLAGDLEKLPDEVAVFAPSVRELYPEGDLGMRVHAGEAGSSFEGASRPGHFDGMLTVVAKLFNLVQPDVAIFGQKDAQQVFLVKQMVRELNFPLVIEVGETVRESDGLALSSRNRFLTESDRVHALALSRALSAAAESASSRSSAMNAAHGILDSEPGIQLDYFELVDPKTFRPVPDDYRGEALAIVAARVGSPRLLDNRILHLG